MGNEFTEEIKALKNEIYTACCGSLGPDTIKLIEGLHQKYMETAKSGLSLAALALAGLDAINEIFDYQEDRSDEN